MSILILIAKLFASLFLVAFFIAGAFKANPRTHKVENGPVAEYTAGFLICLVSLFGFYFLWIN